jgi:hypothetical protein
MTDATVEALIIDLLYWLKERDRTYDESDGRMAHLMPQAPGLGGCER